MTFGTLLYQTRGARKVHNRPMTQTHLAQKVGVTRQTIGNIENGYASPSIDLAVNIARELGISLDSLP